MPIPIMIYTPARIKNILATLGLFFLKRNPIILNNNGGPNIIVIIRATNPFKLPSNIVIFI